MNKETLTSRERVIKTLNREKTDRLPLDFGVHFSTGISGFAYLNLREKLGLSTEHIEMIDMIQLLARVNEDVLERFHIDTILLNPPFPQVKPWNPREQYTFDVPSTCNLEKIESGDWIVNREDCSLKMPSGGFFFDGGWPDYYEMDFDTKLNLFAKRAEKIYKETDYFTLMMGFKAYFDGIDFACDMLIDPEEAKLSNQRLLDSEIEKCTKVIKSIGNHIGAIEINSDLGSQNGLLCTPASYIDVVAPYLSKFCDFVHTNSDYKIFLHSCGAIAEIIPVLIECGVDVLNPVQISANGMQPEALKKKFGDKVIFWGGGCDTQNVLASATAQQVAEHTKTLVHTFKKNGGYVFNQVHNIMGNVPPDNIIAMFDTAYQNSFYTND